MFFIFGIDSGKKVLDYNKTVICSYCGGYGRYQVVMTYSCFSLFFIPIFRWNKQYFVTMTCCNTVYQLNTDIGKRLQHGETVDIREADLTLVRSGSRADNGWHEKKKCSGCGYETTEDFEFCPKCGTRF